MQSQLIRFFNSQLNNWELARNNFALLSTVRVREFKIGEVDVQVHFNPSRIKSSSAKIDAKSISTRPCFLCEKNRPKEQLEISWRDYVLLVNPYPIFPQHFTIPHKTHKIQEILPHFSDMLDLAMLLPDFVVFYNGPKSGASAPDHFHFQAGTKNFLPLIGQRSTVEKKEIQSSVFLWKNYLRSVVEVVNPCKNEVIDIFREIYAKLQTDNAEPMMNVVAFYENECWHVLVLPRKTFRPWQYSAEDESEKLLISPGTAEICGVLIAPVEEHFERISEKDIEDIFSQVSLEISW